MNATYKLFGCEIELAGDVAKCRTPDGGIATFAKANGQPTPQVQAQRHAKAFRTGTLPKPVEKPQTNTPKTKGTK